jgi:DNA-binding transcriptional ArsR family regulator
MGDHMGSSLDHTFFALSHRTRRRMLGQLAGARETRVTDLARRHRLSLNTVSKHVRVLERARLVQRRVAGREHFIRVQPRRFTEAERWIADYRGFWTEQLEALEAFFEARNSHKSKDDERALFADG